MPYGKVKNSAGAFVKADLAGVTAAAAGAAKTCRTISASPSPMRPAKTAYPISSFTWLLIPAKITDAAKRDAMKGFLKWMLTDGQSHDGSALLREAAQGGGQPRR